MCSVEAFPKPRIECIEVESLAAAYSYPLEASMEELVVPVKSRGYLEKSDLVMLAHWKSKRIAKHIAKNDEADVIAATRMALSTDSPKMALHILTMLNGVAFPVASCILHWFHSEKFPILDFRAVWSLGIDQPSAYTLDFWENYVMATRALSVEWDVDMRTLDRALWQYSKEHQPS